MYPHANGSGKGMRVVDRDHGILAGLFECRVMRHRHIRDIYFGGCDEAAKKRLQKLHAAGFIRHYNLHRAPTEPAVHCLGHAGFDLLRESGVIARFEALAGNQFTWKRIEDRHDVRPMTLAHELAVMDIRAAFYRSLGGHEVYSVEDFWTWPLLFQFSVLLDSASTPSQIVKPDGFFHVTRRDGDRRLSRYLFLEVDRMTEGHDRLLQKINGYEAYSGSPEFTQFVAGVKDAGPVPLRTLFVFGRDGHEHGEERLLNFAHALAQRVPSVEHGAVLLATHADVVANPLGSIWITPEMYADALRGTPHDPANGSPPPRSRNAARDALARARIQRCPLFSMSAVGP